MQHTTSRFRGLGLIALTLALALFATSLSAAGPARNELAKHAVSDSYHDGLHDHALWIPGVEGNLRFDPEGSFVELGDGTLRLTGTLYARFDSDKTFDIDVTFYGYTEVAPPGSPKRELLPHAYIENGGPVDPSTWWYYTSFEGTLSSASGAWAGARLRISERGPAFQVGYGASNKNVLFGASGWFYFDVLSQPRTGEQFPDANSHNGHDGRGDFNLELDVETCVERADHDPLYAQFYGGHALWLPGIGKDFAFDAKAGELVEHSDGTARLTGVARRRSDPAEAFEVDVLLTGLQKDAPPGSPKKELRPGAYVDSGGPIDPDTWWYYTDFTGTLTGIEDLAGAVVEISQTGAAFQVGVGANGKNLFFGASSWLLWTVTSQPAGGSLPTSGQGDFNLDLGACFRTCVDRSADADLDYLAVNHGGHAVALQGIYPYKFVLDGEPELREYADHAILRATLRGAKEPTRVFEVDVTFSDRSDTPPAASPKLELPGIAYTAGGGPVDPSSWWYYQTMTGTLTGRDALEGALLNIERLGPALQVGDGASGKNTLFGLSGWLTYTVIDQPAQGDNLPFTHQGDFNLTLGCYGTAALPVDLPPGGCAAAGVVLYEPGDSGNGSISTYRDNPSRALGVPQDSDALNFVSLGFGGTLVVELPSPAANGPGDDLFLFETTFAGKSCGQYPESVVVYASETGRRWTRLGAACQDASFDLGPLSAARYIRLVDDSDPGDFFAGRAADGFDVDGLIAFDCK